MSIPERLHWIEAFALAEMRRLESAGEQERAMEQFRIIFHARKILRRTGSE
jgi:hypothetical protein